MATLDVFADNYIPEVIIDREKERETIKYFLQDVLKGVNKVLCIYGKPGVGKTVVTKHVLNQFDELENACSIYLCASHLTPNLALKEIYEVICGEEKRRPPSPLMVREIGRRLLKKRNYTIAITLDNFDKMNGVESFLWNINNIMETFPRIGLILISTSEAEIRGLVGRRLFSRLRPEYCEFKPYNADRLYEIAEQRIKQAYGRLVISEEALSTLCEFVANECDGNARYLFKLFLNSADIASRNQENKIGLKTIEEVIEEEGEFILKSKLDEIKKSAPRMYEVLRIIAELQNKQEVVYTVIVGG
ncbi:MAG: AAA family ATPase [archaeon YNP-LCB-003-016]|uniref:AAA family ATPase n=1 Tax=Candidatus Culexarchaeum yellowstonense TaxID=2928963 RepID=UPI0026F16AD8|nr:AAA family ATPase [Candidatus Culexarchaeum yellowstonense]MCR6691423.1 AAA family ATPase [Candidatus Culexarchaeum yellowstonense]